MKKLFVILTIIIACATTSVMGSQAPSKDSMETYLDEISYYQLNTITQPTYGSIGGEWTVFGLARYGTISDEFQSIYVSNLKKKADACNGILSTRKYTEYCRVIIALSAIDEDPENFYGYNFIKPLGKFENVIYQGVNGAVYALLALDSKNYKIPETDSGNQTTREKLIGLLLDKELEDGGWSYGGTAVDTDMTAMVVQALAPYCDENTDVKKAVSNGITALGKLQNADGTFSSAGVSNCESTAQVLTALAVSGTSIENKKFVKNGNTVIDGLMVFYNNDGSFKHEKDGSANAMATDQAMYSLTAYYRKICGKNSLYNMSDGLVKRSISQNVISKFEKETTTEKEKTTVQDSKENSSNQIENKKSAKSKNSGNTTKNAQSKKESGAVTAGNAIKESVSLAEEKTQETIQDEGDNTEGSTETKSETAMKNDNEAFHETIGDTLTQNIEKEKIEKEKKDNNYNVMVVIIFLFIIITAMVIIEKYIIKNHKK